MSARKDENGWMKQEKVNRTNLTQSSALRYYYVCKYIHKRKYPLVKLVLYNASRFHAK